MSQFDGYSTVEVYVKMRAYRTVLLRSTDLDDEYWFPMTTIHEDDVDHLVPGTMLDVMIQEWILKEVGWI